VARLPRNEVNGSPSSSVGFKTFNSGSKHRRSGTLDPNFQGSKYATPFILSKEKSNRHRVAEEVKRTVNQSSEIPFLRTGINAMKLSKTHTSNFGSFMGTTGGFTQGSGAFQSQNDRLEQIRAKRLARKEQGWNNNIKPISKFNSQVHPSMRIPFEQI
jgi:hypothetical protein